MARVRLTYRWQTGDEIEVEVNVRSSFPDAVAEAKAQALALFREGYAVAMAGDE